MLFFLDVVVTHVHEPQVQLVIRTCSVPTTWVIVGYIPANIAGWKIVIGLLHP